VKTLRKAPATVTKKLREFTASPPGAGADIWSDFRRIEVLALELAFKFRHSLGKASTFFLELEQRRLMATKCSRCATVWLPPRPVCGNDLEITQWTQLSGRGHVAAAVECRYTATSRDEAGMMVLGYVALDGASTLLLQRIRNVRGRLAAGLPVRVRWADKAVAHPMELFWFEPERQSSVTRPGAGHGRRDSR
jgi:uncharacterized OB-fold protein